MHRNVQIGAFHFPTVRDGRDRRSQAGVSSRTQQHSLNHTKIGTRVVDVPRQVKIRKNIILVTRPNVYRCDRGTLGLSGLR